MLPVSEKFKILCRSLLNDFSLTLIVERRPQYHIKAPTVVATPIDTTECGNTNG